MWQENRGICSVFISHQRCRIWGGFGGSLADWCEQVNCCQLPVSSPRCEPIPAWIHALGKAPTGISTCFSLLPSQLHNFLGSMMRGAAQPDVCIWMCCSCFCEGLDRRLARVRAIPSHLPALCWSGCFRSLQGAERVSTM